MANKFQTKLHNFRYNSFVIKNSFTIEWFKYDLNADLEENISGFDEEELKLFQDYTVKNTTNFIGGKNYFITNEDDLPVEDIYDLVPNERLKIPNYLIIKPKPAIESTGQINSIMQIILTSENGSDNHNYYLPFGVIGRIIEVHN